MNLNSDVSEDILSVQRRISIMFATIGVLVSISNVLMGVLLSGYELSLLISDISFYLTLLLSIPFVVFSFVKRRSFFVQYTQIIVILVALVVSIIDQYNGIYGLLFGIIALSLMFKYRMLERRFLLKISILYLLLVVLIEISAIQENRAGAGFQVVVFITFFMAICYLIFKSDFNRFIHNEKKMKNEIQNLLVDRDALREQIEEKQKQYDKIEKDYLKFKDEKKPFDFQKCNLTPSEIKVIEILVSERASNKEISEKLHIKESTVKQHLYRIFNKIGIDNRIQLIDLCEYNFK